MGWDGNGGWPPGAGAGANAASLWDKKRGGVLGGADGYCEVRARADSRAAEQQGGIIGNLWEICEQGPNEMRCAGPWLLFAEVVGAGCCWLCAGWEGVRKCESPLVVGPRRGRAGTRRKRGMAGVLVGVGPTLPANGIVVHDAPVVLIIPNVDGAADVAA